jgi:hypothetical protein
MAREPVACSIMIAESGEAPASARTIRPVSTP